MLAALTAGAALGFLIYNFPPASSFMGDCGANLLGLMMGVITVEAAVKTAAVVSFVLPLILLAVPFLDTTFVVLKRLKYQPADLPARQRALPPPHGPDRLLQPAHDRLPLRVDADARRPRAGAALRPLLRPQRPPLHRLDARDGRPRAGRRRGERLPRLRAGDPQVPPAGRGAPAAAAAGRFSDRDRAGGRARPGNGRDRRDRGGRRGRACECAPARGRAAGRRAAGG